MDEAMPRPLKVFRAHLGFYDSIVAAPSQKAALAAWGARPVEFAHGFATVTHDAAAVRAALAHPGVVLRRPFGSSGEFKTEAELPKAPKQSPKQKRVAAAAKRARKNKRAANARAANDAEAEETKQAKRDLAAIEREEKRLHDRRLALRAKLRGA